MSKLYPFLTIAFILVFITETPDTAADTTSRFLQLAKQVTEAILVFADTLLG